MGLRGTLNLCHCLLAAVLFWRYRETKCCTSFCQIRLGHGADGIDSVRCEFRRGCYMRCFASQKTYLADLEETLSLDLDYLFRGCVRCRCYCQTYSAIRVLCAGNNDSNHRDRVFHLSHLSKKPRVVGGTGRTG